MEVIVSGYTINAKCDNGGLLGNEIRLELPGEFRQIDIAELYFQAECSNMNTFLLQKVKSCPNP